MIHPGLRNLLQAAAPAALLLGLTGCISFGPKAPPTLFTLTPAAAVPAGTGESGRADQSLLVLNPEAARALDVMRVAVRVDASNIAYLEEAMWAERPARLFRALLAETMRSRGGRIVFEDADAAAPAGATRLGGRLLDMGYDAPTKSAVIRFDALREGAGGAVATRRFEARVPVAEPEPALIGPALNTAANDVARQVADWVG